MSMPLTSQVIPLYSKASANILLSPARNENMHSCISINVGFTADSVIDATKSLNLSGRSKQLRPGGLICQKIAASLQRVANLCLHLDRHQFKELLQHLSVVLLKQSSGLCKSTGMLCLEMAYERLVCCVQPLTSQNRALYRPLRDW